MRLIRLWLEDYYNLKDTEICFNNSDSIYGSISMRFFVGLNGSGKSRTLEAIAYIFSRLSVDAKVGIGFEIEYELDSRHIIISTRKGNKIDRIGASVKIRESPNDNWIEQETWRLSGDGLLPSLIVGYSTGPTSGLPWIINESVNQLMKRQYGNEEDISTEEWDEQREDLFIKQDSYIDDSRNIYLGANDALCAVVPLLAHYGVSDDELKKYLQRRNVLLDCVGLDRNEPLQAFSLLISSSWESKLKSSPRRKKTFQDFLLHADALMPENPSAPVYEEIDSKKKSRDDELPDFYAVFDLSQEFRDGTLKELFRTPLALFRELMEWKRKGVIKSIHLVLKKNGVNAILPERALSDGEYLYLGRYALLLMIREIPECLVLLDEPETHYNDRWRMELIKDTYKFLRDMKPAYSRSNYLTEVIIATHSVLTLTDADPRQVYFFENGEVNPIPISPFAADKDQLSKAFSNPDGDARSYSDLLIEHALRRGDETKIQELLDIVGPGFDRFLLRSRLSKIQENIDTGEDDASSAE